MLGRFLEQLSELDQRVDALVTISPTIKPNLDELSVAAKPGIVASVLQEGMRVDFMPRDPANYSKDPIGGRVTFTREALEKISEAQKKGESITLSDEIVDISLDLISKLFPGATSGGKLVIRPVAGKKLNLRVTVRAGEQFVQYDRIEFTIERPGTEEVEMVSTAPVLPFKIRLVIRFKDRNCSFKINTGYVGHEIRDIVKADLAVSILAAGANVELFDLDSGQFIGTLEQTQTDVGADREALSAFIQAAYDVAEAFAQPLRWTATLDENEFFKAACLAEIVRKGVVQLPVKSPLTLTLTEEQKKTIEMCISQNRPACFHRAKFSEADNIFGTSFEVGPHLVYLVPKEI